MRLLIILAAVLVFTSVYADEMYTWEDADGVHFVDDFSKVPKQYRKKIRKRPGINSNSTSPALRDSSRTHPQREERNFDEQAKIRKMEEDKEAGRRTEAEATGRQFKNRIDLEMRRLQSEKDALRGSPFVDKGLDSQIEKLKNNPEQYFYDEEQRQKNKTPVINVSR